MGSSFDGLVDLVKSQVLTGSAISSQSLQEYLEDAVRRANLFELPVKSEDLFPRSGRDLEEYSKHICDYLDMSREYGKDLLGPFPVTAVETKGYVIIYDSRSEPAKMTQYVHEGLVCLICADVRLEKKGEMEIGVTPHDVYFGLFDEYGPRQMEFRPPLRRLATEPAVAVAEQIAYIMDPENFIIRCETSQSRKQDRREERRRTARKTYRKTVMRPTYVCLEREGMRDLAHSVSSASRTPQWVRGSWRTLQSPRWKNKRGQRIYVAQYFRGDPEISIGGKTYRVMLKEAPDRVVPFTRDPQ